MPAWRRHGPLSGFLLKPVELLDGRASRGARGPRGACCTPEHGQSHAGETRLALFDAFPVGDDEKSVLPAESLPLAARPPPSPAVPQAPSGPAGEVLS